MHLLKPTRVKAEQQAEADAAVRAGRAFYDAGGFASQVDGVAAEVVRALGRVPAGAGGTRQVLGAGCGEGVWLRRVADAVAADAAAGEGGAGDAAVGLWGTVMSKLAVRYAASRQRDASFAVVSPHALPFADGSIDVVFAPFAPAPWDEFCRVLRPGGAVVVARGGPDHLRELRPLAGAPAWRPPKEGSQGFGENYVRLTTEETYRGEVAAALLGMTPFVRRADDAQRAALHEMATSEAGLRVTADVIVSTHRVWLGTGGGGFD